MLTLSLLRSKLRAGQAPSEDAHLSAAELAAFAGRTLCRANRKRAAGHLGNCYECRAVLSLQSSARTTAVPDLRPLVLWGSVAAACVVLSLAAITLKSPPPEAARPAPAAAGNSEPQHFSKLVVDRIFPKKKFEWRVNRSRRVHTLEASVDRGRTWSTVPLPRFEPDGVASDENRVWVADSHHSVMESLDNGAHWMHLKADPGPQSDAIRSK